MKMGREVGNPTGSPRPHPNPLPRGEGREVLITLRVMDYITRSVMSTAKNRLRLAALSDRFQQSAATAMLEGLQLLARAGFRCEAFCGTLLNDDGQNVTVDQVLAAVEVAVYGLQKRGLAPTQARMIFTAHGGVP